MAIGGEALEFIDKKFYDLAIGIAALEVLYDGCRWAEGPVWFGDGNFLVWSDIPNNRMLKWVPDLGVTTFRTPVQLRQRQYPRPRGPADLLLAWRPRRAAHRARWHGDHAGRPLPGQAAQFAQ